MQEKEGVGRRGGASGNSGLRSIQLSLTKERQLMLSFLCSSRRQTGNLSSEGGAGVLADR